MNNEYEIRGDITAIFLRNRAGIIYETIIDTDDLERVMEFPNKWVGNLPDTKGAPPYVVGTMTIDTNRLKKQFRLHRWILNPPDNLKIDHINHDTLNNRRSNIRVCSNEENMWNRRVCAVNKYGISGIYKSFRKWQVRLRVNGKVLYLGSFYSIEEATICRRNAENQYFGEFRPKDVAIKV